MISTGEKQAAVRAAPFPPELLRSIPRDVALTSAGKSAMAVSLVVLLGVAVVGAMFYSIEAENAARRKLLDERGVTTEGRVVSYGKRLRGGGRTVHYSFLRENTQYNGHALLSRGEWRSLPVGTPVTVRYLPADPAQNCLAAYKSNVIPGWWIALIPLGLVAPVALFFCVRKQRRLLSRGRPAWARVLSSKPFKGQSGVQRFRVEYEFTDLSGATHAGRGVTPGPLSVAGAPIAIVYDSDEPEKNAPYPLVLVRTDP